MPLNVSKVPNGPVLAKRINAYRSRRVLTAFSPKQGNGHPQAARKGFSAEGLQSFSAKPVAFASSRRSSTLCFLGKSRDTEAKECVKPYGDCLNVPDSQTGENDGGNQVIRGRTSNSSHVVVDYVSNDAKFVNERARSDIVLLSRGIMRLDARARQDVAILGSKFLKLDARAREDTEKIDRDVKKKAECLHHIATILKNKAQSKLKNAADKHWSDGALEADLRRADFRAKQRAMEDALMALEFIKNIHDMMVRKMYSFSEPYFPGKSCSFF